MIDNVRLDPAPVLGSITEDDLANAGQTVATLLSNIADPDAGALQGIAVTATANGNGHWEYAVDGTWHPFDAVSDGHALLLRASDSVRFVPNGINGTAASLTFHAWDQSGTTAGGQGSYVDLGATGTGGQHAVQRYLGVRHDQRGRSRRCAARRRRQHEYRGGHGLHVQGGGFRLS